MADYEITILTKAESDKDAVKDLVTKVGGDVTDERPLGSRPLAYPIKKEKHAYFTLVRFKMEPERVVTLNHELLLSGHLLRHMITTAKARTPILAGIIGKQPTIKEITLAKEGVASEIAEAKPMAPPDRTGGQAGSQAEKPLAGPALKKTKAEQKVEAQAVKERQKKIEAELEKILKEE